MIVADLQQRRQRRVGGQVAADPLVVFIGVHHHGDGVPAHQALDAPLDGAVARIGDFLLGGMVFMYGVFQRMGTRTPRFAARSISLSSS